VLEEQCFHTDLTQDHGDCSADTQANFCRAAQPLPTKSLILEQAQHWYTYYQKSKTEGSDCIAGVGIALDLITGSGKEQRAGAARQVCRKQTKPVEGLRWC